MERNPIACSPENCGDLFPKCGTNSTYSYKGCRCDACCEAGRDYARKQRAKKPKNATPVGEKCACSPENCGDLFPICGKKATYSNKKCRCDACCAAKAEQARQYRDGNKPRIAASKREYHEKNVDKIRAKKQRHYEENREEYYARLRRWTEENPEKAAIKRRRNWLMRTFKITPAEYDEMLKSQGGTCAICYQDDPSGRRLAVDHDRSCCPGKKSCGKCVRALLCGNCNRGIGMFQDDPKVAQAAVDYLLKFKE